MMTSALLCVAVWAACALAPASAASQPLTDWQLQSSAHVAAGGAAISLPSFNPTGWYNARVPCTVIACLLQNNVRVARFPCEMCVCVFGYGGRSGPMLHLCAAGGALVELPNFGSATALQALAVGHEL